MLIKLHAYTAVYFDTLQVKWSHPFSELKFERLDCDEQPDFRCLSNAVFWNGDVYVSGGDTLCKYSVSRNTWDELQTPVIPEGINHYKVAMYQSKLLLIGATGKVWEFDKSGESGAILFKESRTIPTRPVYCLFSLSNSSVASGNNYLVVSHICGILSEDIHLDIFDSCSWNEVVFTPSFSQHQWQDLVVHNDTIFIIYSNQVYKASAKLLIDRSSEEDLWQRLGDYPSSHHSNVIIHNRQLVAVHIDGESKELYCFANFPDHQSWVEMGKSRCSFTRNPEIIGLPDGAVLALNNDLVMKQLALENDLVMELPECTKIVDILRIGPKGT